MHLNMDNFRHRRTKYHPNALTGPAFKMEYIQYLTSHEPLGALLKLTSVKIGCRERERERQRDTRGEREKRNQ